MELNLSNKIALVSGSGRGIGKAVAEMLIEEGCIVFLNDLEEDVLQKTVEEFRNRTFSDNIHSICSNLVKTENIKSALNKIFDMTGRSVDIAVANIGTGKSITGWDVEDAEWERMFNMNFFGAARLCRESLRVMGQKGDGSIVCIASIAGVESIPAPVTYSAAKAALLSFVKNTADIAARFGVRLNAVSPGNVMFEGSTWDNKLKENPADVMDYINKTVPLKGFADARDIAKMVAFLASDAAQFITGSNFIVDGGQVRKFI